MIQLLQFKSWFPNCVKSQEFVENLNSILPKHNIDSKQRVCAFLAQCGHESGGFTIFIENLNYSKEGLLRVFPKYFNEKDAETFARKPIDIANRVYANRMGNGDVSSGDGYRYRGRGIMQITGKANYSSFSQWAMGNTHFVTNPDIVAQPSWAITSACWYWSKNDLNRFVDKDDFKGLTKAINGGYNGLDDRVNIYNKLMSSYKES